MMDTPLTKEGIVRLRQGKGTYQGREIETRRAQEHNNGNYNRSAEVKSDKGGGYLKHSGLTAKTFRK